MRLWESSQPSSPHTVRQDWRAHLSREKDEAYRSSIHDFDPHLHMFGVSLNEAFDLRNRGYLDSARNQLNLSIPLCARLVASLEVLLTTLERHARHFGTLPSMEPLDPEDFRGQLAKSKARTNATLSLVLWGRQNRFVQKVKALGELVSCQDDVYSITAERVAEGASISPVQDWRALDFVHYDLSSAAAEAKILLKSFLVAVPDNEVQLFRRQCVAAPVILRPIEADRRAAAFRRQ